MPREDPSEYCNMAIRSIQQGDRAAAVSHPSVCCSLIVLPENDTIDSWKTLLEVGTVPANDRLSGKNLGAALRRHSPLLRNADYAFIELQEAGARLADFTTLASRHTNRASIREKLRSGHSVAVEVRAPLNLRFDNGTTSAVPKDEDMSQVLSELAKGLDLVNSEITVLERLIETLRFAEHGAKYIIADDGAIGDFFQGALLADWPGLSLFGDNAQDPLAYDPSKLVATCAGLRMMDGAIVLRKALSLWCYRAMVRGRPEEQVEGRAGSHAFTALKETMGKPDCRILVVMKTSTDGELDVATNPNLKQSGADA